MQNNTFGFSGLMVVALEHVFAFIYITGEILITLGALTRVAVVMQIPIVFEGYFVCEFCGRVFIPQRRALAVRSYPVFAGSFLG